MPGLYTGATGLWGGFAGLLYGSSALSTPPGLLADAGGFTPASLFAQGEQGVWYDPSDMTTLFQDAAGTTPVTAVEQPVGRILDKSGRGNHATQSTSASRPVLSARVNLLTQTEAFDNAAWTIVGINAFGSGSVVNTTATTDPLGGNTAEFVQENSATAIHYLYQSASYTSGVSYTHTIAAKSSSRYLQIVLTSSAFAANSYANFDVTSGSVTASNGVTASITSLGNGWYRCSAIATANATATATVAFAMQDSSTAARAASYAGNGTSGIYIWGADLRVANAGVNLPVYQRVNTSTDYDTTGFPMYLRFDGTDDGMATGTINPGSVDKAQVFAGVRKLSDAAGGVVMELSVASAFNDGTLAFNAPAAGTPDYFWRSKGTISASSTTAASYPAPLTSVMTGIGDIAGDVSQLRYNGTQILNITTDQGTGNYLSYPLYIGRRGGTTLPFNGHLYSLIVRFSATNLPDATIAQTETWVNGKTYAY